VGHDQIQQCEHGMMYVNIIIYKTLAEGKDKAHYMSLYFQTIIFVRICITSCWP